MALHRDIHWIGRQWAVTGFGMQLIDQKLQGFFDIEAAKLWDEALVATMRAKAWLNAADFDKGLAIARARYSKPPELKPPFTNEKIVAAPAAEPIPPPPSLPKPEEPSDHRIDPIEPAPTRATATTEAPEKFVMAPVSDPGPTETTSLPAEETRLAALASELTPPSPLQFEAPKLQHPDPADTPPKTAAAPAKALDGGIAAMMAALQETEIPKPKPVVTPKSQGPEFHLQFAANAKFTRTWRLRPR